MAALVTVITFSEVYFTGIVKSFLELNMETLNITVVWVKRVLNGQFLGKRITQTYVLKIFAMVQQNKPEIFCTKFVYSRYTYSEEAITKHKRYLNIMPTIVPILRQCKTVKVIFVIQHELAIWWYSPLFLGNEPKYIIIYFNCSCEQDSM